MALPPPTYLLLLGLTLAAWPFVRGTARDAGMRHAMALLLGGLLAVEAGLALLFWSRFLCVPLVVAGCAILARVGFPTSWKAVAAAASPAVAAGIAFLLMPESSAFVAYFAIGLPVSLLAAVAAALQRWLRWTSAGRLFLPVAALAFAVGLVPFASFALEFGSLFEVWQSPALVAACAALAWLAARGRDRSERARDRRPDLDGVGYAGHPGPGVRAGRGLLALAAGALLAASGMALAHGIADGEAPARQAGELLALAGASLALAVGSFLVIIGLAGVLADGARRRFNRTPWAGPGVLALVPAAAHVEQGDRVPDAAALAGFRDRLASAGGRLGVLVVDAPGPFATLGEDAEAWLAGQSGPVRVHVAVREGDDAFLVPPILPGEAEP